MSNPAYTVNTNRYELTDLLGNTSSCTTTSSTDTIEIGGFGIDNTFYTFSGSDVSQLREWVTNLNFNLKIFSITAEFKENFGEPIPHEFDWVVTARQFNLKDCNQSIYISTVKDNEPIELGGIGNDNLYHSFSGTDVVELNNWASNLGMEVFDFVKTISYRMPREEDKRFNVVSTQIF
jgi:hypothetical protein